MNNHPQNAPAARLNTRTCRQGPATAYGAARRLSETAAARPPVRLRPPCRRHRSLEGAHAPYLETVPFRVIVGFTLLQLVWTGAVYGLTWAGVAG